MSPGALSPALGPLVGPGGGQQSVCRERGGGGGGGSGSEVGGCGPGAEHVSSVNAMEAAGMEGRFPIRKPCGFVGPLWLAGGAP